MPSTPVLFLINPRFIDFYGAWFDIIILGIVNFVTVMDPMEPTGQKPTGKGSERDRVRLKRKTLEVVLQQCQVALQELTDVLDDDDADGDPDALPDFDDSSSSPCCDAETAEVKDLLFSTCPFFFLR